METAFDDRRLLEELSKMEPLQQLIFGAACCERMLPGYELFMLEAAWGNIQPLRDALDAVWSTGAQASSKVEWSTLLMRCEQCAPDSEDFGSLYTSAAQDATFAVCALLEFLLDGDPSHVVGAARFSIDSIDLIVQERENMDPRDADREQKILEHRLMQQELVRQQRDLAQAMSIPQGDTAALAAFRMQARGEFNLVAV